MKTDMEKKATDELLKNAEALIERSVAYIAATQPVLDKVAAEKAAYQKAVPTTVHTMLERGLITSAEADQLTEKLAADPVMGLRLAERLASQVGADSLGKKATDVKIASGTRLDAFEALVLTGDPSNTKAASPGMVE